MKASAPLVEAAALSPFFDLVRAGEGPSAAGLYADGLGPLISGMRQRLGTGEDRVAASTLHLSLVAKLWSPVLFCALHGVVPDLAGLRFRTDDSGFWLPGADGWANSDPADLVYAQVVAGQLAPLGAAIGREVKIADGLLWGNAGSALIGALRVITGARRDLAAPARSLAERLLSTGLLAGSVEFTGPGLTVRRNSCCLYYRLPNGGLCGDCSLTA
ncbi:MAG: (2Fe-2S)-binding protein [Streptosporangiaceae bacterium]